MNVLTRSPACGAPPELLGDALQNRISLRILRKAGELELAQFEDPATYDALQNAYREVGSRPLQVYTQLLTLVQSLITLGSVSALMFQLGPLVVPLILLGTIPGVIVSTRFGTENYRMLRRQASDARVQNYIGRLLTDDTAVKEIRLFDFGGYLLDRWRAYYERFRASSVTRPPAACGASAPPCSRPAWSAEPPYSCSGAPPPAT